MLCQRATRLSIDMNIESVRFQPSCCNRHQNHAPRSGHRGREQPLLGLEKTGLDSSPFSTLPQPLEKAVNGHEIRYNFGPGWPETASTLQQPAAGEEGQEETNG